MQTSGKIVSKYSVKKALIFDKSALKERRLAISEVRRESPSTSKDTFTSATLATTAFRFFLALLPTRLDHALNFFRLNKIFN